MPLSFGGEIPFAAALPSVGNVLYLHHANDGPADAKGHTQECPAKFFLREIHPIKPTPVVAVGVQFPIIGGVERLTCRGNPRQSGQHAAVPVFQARRAESACHGILEACRHEPPCTPESGPAPAAGTPESLAAVRAIQCRGTA